MTCDFASFSVDFELDNSKFFLFFFYLLNNSITQIPPALICCVYIEDANGEVTVLGIAIAFIARASH